MRFPAVAAGPTRKRSKAEPWWAGDAEAIELASQLRQDRRDQRRFKRKLRRDLQRIWDKLPAGGKLTAKSALAEVRRRGKVTLPSEEEGGKELLSLVRSLLKRIADSDSDSS